MSVANRRSLHKKISLNTELDAVSDQAALLYTWMIAHADDFGRLTGNVRKLAATVVPLRRGRPGWTDQDIERYLQELENARDEAGVPLIVRYTAQGVSVIWLTGFDNLQDGLHKRTRSLFPDPPEELLNNFPGISRNFRKENGTSRNAPEVPVGEENFPEIPFRNEEKGNEDEYELETNRKRREGESFQSAPLIKTFQQKLEANGYMVNPAEVTQIEELCRIHGSELVNEAIEAAFRQKRRPTVKYVAGILRAWAGAGLKTVEEVRRAEGGGRARRSALAVLEEIIAKGEAKKDDAGGDG